MGRPANVPPKMNTRRPVILGLACLLPVLLAVSLLGCGSSDKKQAQGYLQAGADQIQKIQKQAAEWQHQLISTSGETDPSALKKGVEEIKVSATELTRTVDGAKAEYEKISRLNGVNDYVRYADLRSAQLDMIRDMLNKTNEYLDKKVAMFNSGDLSGLAPLEQQYSNQISSISDKIQKIESDATKFKKDKKL